MIFVYSGWGILIPVLGAIAFGVSSALSKTLPDAAQTSAFFLAWSGLCLLLSMIAEGTLFFINTRYYVYIFLGLAIVTTTSSSVSHYAGRVEAASVDRNSAPIPAPYAANAEELANKIMHDSLANENNANDGVLRWHLYSKTDKMTDKTEMLADAETNIDGLNIQAEAHCKDGYRVQLNVFRGKDSVELEHHDQLASVRGRGNRGKAEPIIADWFFKNQAQVVFDDADVPPEAAKEADESAKNLYDSSFPPRARKMATLVSYLVELKPIDGEPTVVEINPQDNQFQIFINSCLISSTPKEIDAEESPPPAKPIQHKKRVTRPKAICTMLNGEKFCN